jgi:Arc/MetJ-type ribon-helix-helix transcriptional regulator
MSNASEDIKKSSRGRPRSDTAPIMVRMAAEEIADIDAWIASEGPPFVTRPEAIRRLVRKALDKE